MSDGGPTAQVAAGRRGAAHSSRASAQVKKSDSASASMPVGALPAMVVIDSVTRLLPGVLGDDASAMEESFSHGLLEYPQYTPPAEFRGKKVPDILVSGNHADIASWRLEQAKLRTKERRPDLI